MLKQCLEEKRQADEDEHDEGDEGDDDGKATTAAGANAASALAPHGNDSTQELYDTWKQYKQALPKHPLDQESIAGSFHRYTFDVDEFKEVLSSTYLCEIDF